MLRHHLAAWFHVRDRPMPFDNIGMPSMSTRAEAASIKNCAAANGVKERAVRAWRAKRDPRWLAWKVKEVRSATQGELGGLPVNTSPEAEEAAAAGRFVALTNMVDSALGGGNQSGLPLLLKSAQEAQKLLQGCRAATLEHRKATGDLVSRADVMGAFLAWQTPIAAVLNSLPERLSSEFPPESSMQIAATAKVVISTEMRAVKASALEKMRAILGEIEV
jgi:hypothetical protein